MKKKKLFKLLIHACLIFFTLLVLCPVLWIVRTSFATELIAYELPPRFIFRPTLANYKELFTLNNFGKSLLNSLIMAVLATVVAIPIGALAGYAFAKYRTGGNTLRFLILATQMLPGIILIVPLFIIYNQLGFIDTHVGISVAYLSFVLPFVVWMLMGFFQGVPDELEDAALIDGCSRFSCFFRIIFPICAPGIMAAAVLSFINCWNEFLFALVLTSNKSETIPVAVGAMQSHRGVMMGRLSAATIVAIVPMIFLSFFVKKYLIRGLTFGAIK